ncbi:MAG: YceI family protein [Rhodobacteraceae bacterium]|nr:YceI family protein [Paracoccaceae bacterium]
MTYVSLAALGFGAVVGALASVATAEPIAYSIDPGHSAAAFRYNHAGFSTTYGMIQGVEGEILFDRDIPANSSVEVTLDLANFDTGWAARDSHLLDTGDFFDPKVRQISFRSTGIDVTGPETAKISGDLTLNGVTKPITLDASLTTAGEYPFPPNQGKPAAGFTATTTLTRSEYGLGMFAPFISDEVEVEISIEAISGREPA